MSDGLNQPYGHYPKKRCKKGSRLKDNPFLRKTSQWFRWRLERLGEIRIYRPCLEN